MVNYIASRFDKTNFLPILYVIEVKESISDIFTELPCSHDLENLGQLPVLLPILALIANTVALVCMYFCYFIILHVIKVEESIFHSFTKLSCSGNLGNPGQLPVSQVLEGTDDWVLRIFVIFSFPTFSRSRNPFLAVLQSHHNLENPGQLPFTGA